MTKIWGKYQGSIEQIDEANTRREAERLAGEYRMAFGADWKIWVGLKREEPKDG